MLLCLFACTTVSLYSQVELHGHTKKQVKSHQDYSLVEYPEQQLKALTQLDIDTSLIIHLDNNVKLDIELLDQVHLVSDDILISRQVDLMKHIELSIPEIKIFHGKLKNRPQSKVLFSSIGEEFSLYINDENNTLILEKNVSGIGQNNVYKLKQNGEIGIQHKYQCKHQQTISKEYKSTTVNTNCKVIDINVHSDLEFYRQYGNSSQAIARIINSISSSAFDYYSSRFNDEIKFRIREIRLNNCESCQVAPGVTDPGKLLALFDTYLSGQAKNSDINLLFTGKSLDDLFIGMSHLNSICNENARAIIQNIEDTSWEQRVVLSHEIGHILGCSHDDTMPNIMSSSLTNSSAWTESSVSIINNQLATQTCMLDCSASSQCVELNTIQISEVVNGNLQISWSYDHGTECLIELIDIESENIVYSNWSNGTNLSISDLLGCRSYRLSLKSFCPDGSINREYVKVFSTYQAGGFEITQIDLAYCDETSFGIKVSIESEINRVQDASLSVGNLHQSIQITNRQQQFVISGLTSWLADDISVRLDIFDNDLVLCADIKHFDSPDTDCSYRYNEAFNPHAIPEFWEYSSSNMETFEGPFIWQFDDGDREISNYGKYGNANSTKTIDGSAMAYLDDDVYSNNSFTGMSHLYTPKFDLTPYEFASFSMEFIFHKFIEKGPNSSQFISEVWNGTNWVVLHNATSNSCAWNNIWDPACVEFIDIDVSQYINPELQFRFYYTDGNDNRWTGMVALDNIVIKAYNAISGCMDANATNYNVNATISDPSSCSYPCLEAYMLVSEYPVDQMTIADADVIEAIGNVDKSVDILAQTKIILSPSFRIEQGNTVRLSHQNCNN